MNQDRLRSEREDLRIQISLAEERGENADALRLRLKGVDGELGVVRAADALEAAQHKRGRHTRERE